jgi:regulator of RNase E activity RraB
MEKIEKVVIEFTGFITVAKEDLKIIVFDKTTGNMVDVDTTDMTTERIVEGLKKFDFYLKSFTDTYNQAIDGNESLTFDVDDDDDDDDE